MEKFRKPVIEDRDKITEYLNKTSHRACDYSAANIILWSDVYHTEITFECDMLIIKSISDGKAYFSYPMGDGDVEAAFEWIKEYCSENKIEFQLQLIEPDMFEIIEKLYPGEYKISYSRDSADYVYNIQDLANLSGKKYHGKKNHVNKFLKTYENWEYETITDENTAECISMIKEWCVENHCCEDESKAAEICVVINGLHHRTELHMHGGIIRANNKIVALTLGEQSGDDMFIIHFEKAFADVQGAYPIINQQFILHELMDYTYVNREEDMGIEGLRKAKESYYPTFMAEKGVVVRR